MPDRAARPPLRVLLLDPDPIHCDDWSALLTRAGYDVACSPNCFEAMIRLAEGFHCVLLEYALEDLDGIEFIRRLSVPPAPAFVLLTHETSSLVHVRALEAGAAASLQKPSSLHGVVAAIEQACSSVSHTARGSDADAMIA